MTRWLCGLAAVVAVVGPVGCAAAADKVAIGMSAGLNQVPSLVAAVKGYFKEQGLEVDLKPVARGAVAIEGVSGGSLQFAESAHVPFMAAVAKGVPLIAVGIAARGFYGKLVAAPKNAHLKTLADFKGKKIGTQVGTGMYTVIQMLMEQQGLKPEDFKITNLRIVDMPAAMAAPSNDFDAVIGWEPGMQRIVKGGFGKVLITPKEIEEMAQITYPFMLTTTREYHDKNAAIVQKVLNAYAKAHKFARENENETARIYAAEVQKRGGKLTEDDAKVMLYDTARFGGPAVNGLDMKDIVATRAYLLRKGTVKGIPEPDQIMDRSFGQKAEAAITH